MIKFTIKQERNLGQEYPWFYLKSRLFKTAEEAEKARKLLEQLQEGDGEGD